MIWVKYDRELWHKQKLPQERQMVLLLIAPELPHTPCVVAGYLKYAAGDKHSPYFVHPGLGDRPVKITHWSDCLPSDFDEQTFPIMQTATKDML